MKETIERQGKIYESVQSVVRRFDICTTTFHSWRKKYGFVAEIQVGNKKFYDREKIDNSVGFFV